MNNAEQQFLNELDNKFCKAADKLRANMDAANYKHVVSYTQSANQKSNTQAISCLFTERCCSIFALLLV